MRDRAAGAEPETLPPPPPGASPTLAMVRAVPLNKRLGDSAVIALVFVLLAIGFHVARGLDWPTTLAIFGIGLLLVLRAGLSIVTSAGENWLRVGRRWVDTGTLIDVRTRVTINGTQISLRDRSARTLRTRLSYITDSATIWKLFHAGLLRSLESGLDPDVHTRRLLDLDRAVTDTQTER